MFARLALDELDTEDPAEESESSKELLLDERPALEVEPPAELSSSGYKFFYFCNPRVLILDGTASFDFSLVKLLT